MSPSQWIRAQIGFWLIIALFAFVFLVVPYLHARENTPGEFDDIPKETRDWFKPVRSPHGVPCCDIADGHHTTWRGTTTGGYEVPIGEEPDGSPHWVPLPPEAVVYDAGNPTGDAIVWYVFYPNPQTPYIRCFVPGGGV